MRANDSSAANDKYNPYAPEYIGVEKFLDIISLEPTSSEDDERFCLSHVFTYRDFEDGVLGLAWVAEPGKMVVLFLFYITALSLQTTIACFTEGNGKLHKTQDNRNMYNIKGRRKWHVKWRVDKCESRRKG